MSIPLLATKLYIPPVRAALVARPRLQDRLAEGLSRKLTLVSAPAGFGKTTLVSAWIAGEDVRAAWLTLEAGDNDLARFWAYVVTALQTVEPAVGVVALGLLQSPQPPPIEAVLTVLLNDLADLPFPVVLILDDYHLVEVPPIHQALAFLLDHLPPSLHLVLVTRVDPPLPIARLRARSQLVELREADLRFTAGESAAFLREVMRLDLSAADVEALAGRTEGWVAGLQMAAVSMQGKPDLAAFIDSFSGSHQYIADYLTDEVLSQLPEPQQEFLLQTAILDRLTAPLCEAVTGQPDGQATLAHLMEANLFLLPLDDERRWYRYHGLFAEWLRQRLRQSQPDRVPALHRQAGAWYAEQGLVGEAVGHALAASDFEWAADLLENAAVSTLMRSEIRTFLTWADALPEAVVRARPVLSVYLAWALLLNGRPLDEVQAWLPDDAVDGAALALQAVIAVYQGDAHRSTILSRQALDLLPEDSLFLRSLAANNLTMAYIIVGDNEAALRAIDESVRVNRQFGNIFIAVGALANLAGLMIVRGELDRSEALCRQALDLATDDQGRLLPIAGKVLLVLGELARERCDLPAATRHFEDGIALAEGYGEVTALVGYLSLAFIRRVEGDSAGAQALIDRARRLAAAWDTSQLDDFLVDVCQVRLWAARGDLDRAQAWIEARGLEPPPGPHALDDVQDARFYDLREVELLTLARVLLARSRPDEALAVLEPLLVNARQHNRGRRLVEILVLQALAYQARDDDDHALAALAGALDTAAPAGYAWAFIDTGPPMMRLLYRAVERDIQADYARRLLALAASIEKAASPQPFQGDLVEPLSEREIEVLALIADGCSNQVIAQELVLSLSTVKWHTSNIYGKLGVRSRTQAVAQARALGILPPA